MINQLLPYIVAMSFHLDSPTSGVLWIVLENTSAQDQSGQLHLDLPSGWQHMHLGNITLPAHKKTTLAIPVWPAPHESAGTHPVSATLTFPNGANTHTASISLPKQPSIVIQDVQHPLHLTIDNPNPSITYRIKNTGNTAEQIHVVSSHQGSVYKGPLPIDSVLKITVPVVSQKSSGNQLFQLNVLTLQDSLFCQHQTAIPVYQWKHRPTEAPHKRPFHYTFATGKNSLAKTPFFQHQLTVRSQLQPKTTFASTLGQRSTFGGSRQATQNFGNIRFTTEHFQLAAGQTTPRTPWYYRPYNRWNSMRGTWNNPQKQLSLWAGTPLQNQDSARWLGGGEFANTLGPLVLRSQMMLWKNEGLQGTIGQSVGWTGDLRQFSASLLAFNGTARPPALATEAQYQQRLNSGLQSFYLFTSQKGFAGKHTPLAILRTNYSRRWNRWELLGNASWQQWSQKSRNRSFAYTSLRHTFKSAQVAQANLYIHNGAMAQTKHLEFQGFIPTPTLAIDLKTRHTHTLPLDIVSQMLSLRVGTLGQKRFHAQIQHHQNPMHPYWHFTAGGTYSQKSFSINGTVNSRWQHYGSPSYNCATALQIKTKRGFFGINLTAQHYRQGAWQWSLQSTGSLRLSSPDRTANKAFYLTLLGSDSAPIPHARITINHTTLMTNQHGQVQLSGLATDTLTLLLHKSGLPQDHTPSRGWAQEILLLKKHNHHTIQLLANAQIKISIAPPSQHLNYDLLHITLTNAHQTRTVQLNPNGLAQLSQLSPGQWTVSLHSNSPHWKAKHAAQNAQLYSGQTTYIEFELVPKIDPINWNL